MINLSKVFFYEGIMTDAAKTLFQLARSSDAQASVWPKDYGMLRTLAPILASSLSKAFSKISKTVPTNLTMAQEFGPRRVPIPPNGVDYRGKIVLAPMVRTGELPTRLLALKYGADLVWGPETIDKSMIGTTRRECPRTGTIIWTRQPSVHACSHQKTLPPDLDATVEEASIMKENVLYRLHPTREKGKLIYQMGTADPKLAVEAARLVAADVAGIDVNAGCPKSFSTSGGMGAALLQTPELLCSILRALVEQIVPEFGIGISVKIRLLDTVEQTEALVTQLCGTGISGLTIHCRTTPMRPRQRAIRDERLEAIIRVCKEAGVALLINGDVGSRDHAMQWVKEYGVDGAMIATCAEKNPSIFRSADDGGKAEWRQLVREYLTEAISVENRWGNTKFMLNQLMPGKELIAKNLAPARSHEQVVTMLEFDELIEKAKGLDKRLGMVPNTLREKHIIRQVKAKPQSTMIDSRFSPLQTLAAA